MAIAVEDDLRFTPSRVEGLPLVTEVAVFPKRLELLSQGRRVAVRLADIAKWPRPRWLRRLLAWAGWQPVWLPVADRDWFHAPSERYFRFYSTPPITIYMPDDAGLGYGETIFWRIQNVIARGGFSTFDLG